MNPTPIAGTQFQNHERRGHFSTIYQRARRTAAVRSAAAVARAFVPPGDREDLEQEAMAACWCALASFDPRRASLRTYIECVVATRIASAVRTTHRLRVLHPLDLVVDHCVGPEFRRHELQIDVQRVLGICNDAERRLALLLMEHTPSQVSLMLGVARSTVYERMRRLRPRFVAAGLAPVRFSDQRPSSK